MSPVTHLLVSWAAASLPRFGRRERVAVTLVGVSPDADAAGLVVDLATRATAHPTDLWSAFHHVLGHNIGFCLLATVAAWLATGRRAAVAGFAFAVFHLHLLGDLLGARGPEGYQWPIPYLLPASGAWQLTWVGQWPLNGWQNFAVTLAAVAFAFRQAWRHGFSPLELASARANDGLVAALRARFGKPPPDVRGR